ncbi:glycosyltransferase [Candidatus Poribacteria bacterium]|nr:glycosyltransferase [Candidatus Poribacteria bacterium]
MNSLKSRLKANPLVYRVNTFLKARSVERKIEREQAYYGREAQRRGLPLKQDEAELTEALMERLTARGLSLSPKPKDALHIVYATRPSNWEPHNIPPELAKFGKVTTYYYSERGFDDRTDDWLNHRAELDKDLLQFVTKVHQHDPVDVFVGYLGGWQVAAETIRAIGELGILTCAFHWDDKPSYRGRWAGGRWSGPAATAAAYDLNLTNAPSSIIKYQVEGGLALFWPEAANPGHFRPLNRDFKYDVSFIGACYGQRPTFIQYLRSHGVNVETFGPGWPNGAVPESDMVGIYACSRINLGFGGIGYSMKQMCLKGRDFEVPLCGALYLTSDNPELRLVYEVGKEIVTYRNKQDCLAKIRYLLEHSDECAQIRLKGRTRCLHDHTWEVRFQRVFERAGVIDAVDRGTPP